MEKDKMLNGKIYDISDKELESIRTRTRKLTKSYNDTFDTETKKRNKILTELLPNMGAGTYLQGPIQFDYGCFIKMGTNCYANYNLTILDGAWVTIGNDVFFGPNCTLVTPVHPFLAEERKMCTKRDGTIYDIEYTKPITIGNGCWLASNVVVCGGVSIGNNCVIGAGSVVTKNIPDNSFAAGNPCRVIRQITEKDSLKYRNDLY